MSLNCSIAITYGDSSWKDLLTNYNGTNITYDQIGNPANWHSGMSFTWQNGRQLQGITKGTNTYSYTYDADGLRTSKTVNGVTTNYYTIEGILLAETKGTDTIRYLQDNNGKHYGFIYNGTMYYYTFNLQGDVTGILDSTGVKVVEYTYDIWGKVLSVTGTLASTIGQINPIRYRGYYYDSETGFYYLQSRYYDPEVGRFLNADGYVSTGIGLLGYNMFAYCNNNPVIFVDSNGTRPIVGASLENESDHDRDLSFSYMKELYAKSSDSTSSAKGDYDDYLKALRDRESTDNYTAVNQFNFLGAYQMGNAALIDAGFKDHSGNWTDLANSYGVYSSNDFLNTPRAQDFAITQYNKKVVGYITYFELDSYVGTSYCGITVTKSGLLAACHLVGIAPMISALSTGEMVWDGNGVPASEYMGLFCNYDISEVW